MKMSKKKLVMPILAASLVLGGVLTVTNSGDKAEANPGYIQTNGQSLEQLKNKALQIVPGTVVKSELDYDWGQQVAEFEILTSNGFLRDISLKVTDGSVWDLEGIYNADGSESIPEKSRFQVVLTADQAKVKATERMPGTVLRVSEEVENGRFRYDVLVRQSNGMMYDVTVDAVNGQILEIDHEDDYYPQYGQGGQVPGGAPASTPTATPAVSTPTPTPVNNTPAPAAPAPAAPAPAAPAPAAPAPSNNSGGEAAARRLALQAVPGTVVYYEQEWDDGSIEYEYKIRNQQGYIVEVTVQWGVVTDIDWD